jgi:hypothetical protein
MTYVTISGGGAGGLPSRGRKYDCRGLTEVLGPGDVCMLVAPVYQTDAWNITDGRESQAIEQQLATLQSVGGSQADQLTASTKSAVVSCKLFRWDEGAYGMRADHHECVLCDICRRRCLSRAHLWPC